MKSTMKGKRLLAAALSALLAITGMPAAAFAQGPAPQSGGLCEHHPEHDNECGYAKGQPCGHEHSADCYTDELICGYGEEDADEAAAASGSSADHMHTLKCYKPDCPHKAEGHDDGCGYVKARPCGYICELCEDISDDVVPDPEGENFTPSPHCTLIEGCTLADGHEGDCTPELPPSKETLVKTITGWTFVGDHNLNDGQLPLTGVRADHQADFDTVVSLLPAAISAEIEGESGTSRVEIDSWSCPEYTQDADGSWPLSGEYSFVAVLQEGYTCEQAITVEVLLPLSGAVYGLNETVRVGGINYRITSVPGEDNGTVAVSESQPNPPENIVIPASITIPDSNSSGTYDVTAIGDLSFWEKTIKSLDLSGATNLNTIGKEAFSDTTLEGLLTIPENVTFIGIDAFRETNITSLDLSGAKKLVTIGDGAFCGLPLVGALVIPGNVTYIGTNAFALTSISSLDLSGADKLETIDGGAFYSIKLLKTVTIPGNVKTIGDGAFENSGLTTIDLSKAAKLQSIGNSAFRNTKLASITIPETVNFIDNFAFMDCDSLTSITFTGDAPTLGKQVFDGTPDSLIIYVPDGASGYDSEQWPADKVVEGPALPLSGLTISSGTLIPAFRPGMQAYTVTVPTSVNTVTVTPTSIGEITVNGKMVTSGSPSEAIGLEAGKSHEITIVVKTSDQLNRTYTINIIREAIVSISDIQGVTAPVRGAAPVTAIAETGQYTGTVSWSPALTSDGTFAADTEYTAAITLTPKTGYTLQGVPANFFTVPGSVTATYQADTGVITAVFPKTDKVPAYTITVENTGNGTASASPVSAAEGDTVTLSAAADHGYHFKEWIVISGDITITDNRFTMPAGNVSLKAVFEKDGSSSSGGNSSGGDSSGNSASTGPKTLYTVTENQISQSVSRSDLQRLSGTGKRLTIQSGAAKITFTPAALNAILAAVPATAGNISLSAVPADLNQFPGAAALIGAHPVYDFTVGYTDGSGNRVNAAVDFPAGSAFIALNYSPASAEAAGNLFMVYVDDGGAVTWLHNSAYDNGRVWAEIPLLSVYGVAYKAPAAVYADIENHWAKTDIEFAAARGLLPGTGSNTFSPDGIMTRSMFAAALGRLAAVSPEGYQTRSFADVAANADYAPYAEWAVQKNILTSVGDGIFSPDTPVTREQMAVIMAAYAGQTGSALPAPLTAAAFADSGSIGAWAANDVASMQRAGIIKSRDNNRFDPQANATRAEAAAVLRRFVAAFSGSDAANGWARNDSGQWLYYSGGSIVTGWKELDGKWYYFGPDGAMAVNTTVDGYEIGTDGAMKQA